MPTPTHTTHPPHRPHRRRHDWRCEGCGRLLGVQNGDAMHIRTGKRGNEYITAFPVTAGCSRCGTLNRISVPRT